MLLQYIGDLLAMMLMKLWVTMVMEASYGEEDK